MLSKKLAVFIRIQDKRPFDEAVAAVLPQVCRRHGFDVVDLGSCDSHEAAPQCLPSEPALVFLPLIEQDCLSVKAVQDILGAGGARVVLLYGDFLPAADYLCLAFREGVDDIVHTRADEHGLDVQIDRAERLLRGRVQDDEKDGRLQHKIESLTRLCEELQRSNDKWQERLLSLATTAGQLATGELRLGEASPHLLVAAASASQAKSAAELARRLGFDVETALSGKEALEKIELRPPRVILTNGSLGDMDAPALAQAARKTLGARPVMVIAWSSSPENEAAFLAPEAGIDDFVIKSASNEGAERLTAALLAGLR